MGQYEVFKWLKEQYECGKMGWFTVQDIEKGLKSKGYSNGVIKNLRADCIKLSVSKCILIKDLDTTGLNNYKRVFKYELPRVKKNG